MLPNHVALAAILIGACVCSTPALSAAHAMPPAPASRPSILTYETVKVGEGIVAFITPEER